MEAEWYRRICLVVDQACPHRRRARQQFGDHLVLKVYFWAVLHGRPVSWACVADHWPDDDDLRPGSLPSQPTMSRRLRTVGVRQALERTHGGVLADRFPPTPLKQVDSKPLVVGNYTKDSDAKRGRGGPGRWPTGTSCTPCAAAGSCATGRWRR